MWLVRLRIREARPWARGRNRLRVGPSSTNASVMNRSSGSRRWLRTCARCSALATAESSTLPTGSLAACGSNFMIACASLAGSPRMRSTTRRTLVGDIRTYFAVALPTRTRSGMGSDTTRPPLVLDVPAERTCRRELAELVPDHRLGHEDRYVLAPVVHRDGVTEHRRHDHRAARPRLDDVLGALVVLRVHLLHQVVVDEGTLLQTPWHLLCLLAPLRGLAATHDHAVALLVRTAGAPLWLAPRADWVPAT